MEEKNQEPLRNSSLNSINESTESKPLDSYDESEEIDDSFICCVCLDLLYKPVVLACGHISCFWCVSKAMNAFQESHCPLCASEYNHFPSICELLHFLLLKMYPVTYKRREKEMSEEETKNNFFSPQLDENNSCISPELNTPCPPTSSIRCSETVSHAETYSSGKANPFPIVDSSNSVESFHGDSAKLPESTCSENFKLTENVYIEENNDLNHRACRPVSIKDALCGTCGQLLFRPVVLNCGHVYCESCLAIPENETFKCKLCQSPHRNGSPKVCLVLHNFLGVQFCEEYVKRREEVQLKAVHSQQGIPSACTTQAEKKGGLSSSSPSQAYSSWLTGSGPGVHIGVGCDYCGMYPIVGERYRCKDCKEMIGFDLCGECYNTRSKRPGRFNQQHTLEHSFELIPSERMHNLIMRLIPGQSEDDSASSDDAPDNPEEFNSAI